MNNKLEEISFKLSQLLHKKEEEEKRNCSIVLVLAIIGAVAAIAAIGSSLVNTSEMGEYTSISLLIISKILMMISMTILMMTFTMMMK